MKTVLAFLLFAGAAFAQYPDAPSAIVKQADGTYCIGTTCGWKQADLPPEPAGFWTFRGVKEVNGRKVFDWNAPPLRTNRQAFNKKLLVLHGLAAVAMIVACKRRNSGEEFGSEIPAVAAITAGDYVMTRFFSESMSVEAPLYAIGHYVHSAWQ